MNQLKQSIKSLWRDLGTRRWIFLLALGFLIVVAALPTGSKQDQQEGTDPSEQMTGDLAGEKTDAWNDTGSAAALTKEEYERRLEERLTAILSLIEGAGQVEVMVTVKSSVEKVLQTDTERQQSIINETDSSGGTRQNSEISESYQTVKGGGSSSEPYVIQEIMPQVEGVLVTCEGGDRASVQSEISGAVQALFGIEAHKIKVCKMAIQ